MFYDPWRRLLGTLRRSLAAFTAAPDPEPTSVGLVGLEPRISSYF